METPICCSFAFVVQVWTSYRTQSWLPHLLIHQSIHLFLHSCAFIYLLLVFPLQVQSGLDVTSGLLEGLSLGDLSRVVSTDPNHVSAQEDQHVGTDLKTQHTQKHDSEGEKGEGEKKDTRTPPSMHMSHHKNTVNSI